MHSNNIELINKAKIEWGSLTCLQPLYKAYPNPLPYPPLVAEFNGNLYLIDGAKRLAGLDTGAVLFDSSIKLNSEQDQLATWQKINRSHRELNLLERSVLMPCPHKNILKLPLNIQMFIAVNEPSYTILSMLDYAPQKVIKILEKILTLCTPGNSTLKLLLDTLLDLNSREELNVAEEPEFFSLIEQSGIKEACNKLIKLRNPALSQKNSLLKKEALTSDIKNIKIEYDETFESDHITIKANLKNASDVDKVIKELTELKENNKIKKFLDIYES